MINLCIVGATGLVGSEILKVLEERNFTVNNLYLVASEKSIGKEILFCNKTYKVISIEEAINNKPDIAIFSAGSGASLKYAPVFANNGTTVIDNSSAWRMDNSKKLIVPEVNGNILTKQDKIIANPNCSTIQMVVALAPLHKKYGIKRLVISTYQSVTGTGQNAVKQMFDEREGKVASKVYLYPIDLNCFPHGGDFLENGYTTEEEKLVSETRKILEDNTLNITATVVRIPVVGGHSEAVNIELRQDFEISDITNLLSNSKGIIIQDDIKNKIYPMPLFSHGRDEVFVGRIRRDFSCEKALNMWIVADNLRKGAATNAIQIAEYLIENNLIN